MYCAQCGTQDTTGGDTCEVCGAPLSPRSGPETCPACHAPISTYDRYCQACGEALGAPSGGPRFEPGPSFVDDEPLKVSPSDLPPWLRDLAAAPPPSVAEEPAPGDGDEKLPDWLRAARSQIDELPQAEPEPESTDQTPFAPTATSDDLSLIGEDDLPEWLRVLGDEEPVAAEFRAEAGGARTVAAAAVLDVPSVSRAWLTQPRAVDVNAVAAARPDFFPAEAEAVGAPAMHAEAIPTEVAPEPAPVAPPEPVAAVSERVRRIRILLLTLSILVILLVVYLLAGLPR